MRPAPKIATCCYCNARSVLKLTGKVRHELACASCGAPLRYLKPLPVEQRRDVKPSRRKAPPRKYEKPRRKRRSFWQKAVAEIWDEIEDIFD